MGLYYVKGLTVGFSFCEPRFKSPNGTHVKPRFFSFSIVLLHLM